MSQPSITVIKTLFALSGNTCAYTGCEERLTDPAWPEVKADIAHIRGERPLSARFDPSVSEADLHGFENLMLLCPNHHRRIDRLEPMAHPVDLLLSMKHHHEARSAPAKAWATDGELTRSAELAVLALLAINVVAEDAYDESRRIIEEAREAANSVRRDLVQRAEEEAAELRERNRREADDTARAASIEELERRAAVDDSPDRA